MFPIIANWTRKCIDIKFFKDTPVYCNCNKKNFSSQTSCKCSKI